MDGGKKFSFLVAVTNRGGIFFFHVILRQKTSRKHKRWFSVLPVLSKIFTKNMKLLQILAKVIKILKNGLLYFLLAFCCKIRWKRKISYKKIPPVFEPMTKVSSKKLIVYLSLNLVSFYFFLCIIKSHRPSLGGIF